MNTPNPQVRRAHFGLLLALGILALGGCGTSPPGLLDAQTHRQVLVEVADVIRDHYADPEVGRALADTIMAHVEGGGADSPIEGRELVAWVMGVIRSQVADRHFELVDRSAEPEDDVSLPRRRERSEHGLRSVRMLDGGVACFELDGFPGDDASLSAVSEAIKEQPEMRAVIFDIRDNNGGAGDMVVMLCNLLVEPDALLYTFAGRDDDAPKEVRSVPGDGYLGTRMPVYILTSGDTLSAAEAFTCILQDLGRAVVVGERTAGMANPSRTFTIADRFDLTVPFLIMRYGKSGATPAGTGVVPDIEVPAESALKAVLERLADSGN
jgi:hypothetical protein